MVYKNLLNALRNGNVSDYGISSLCTGRENEVNEFEILLNEVTNDYSIVKFLNGEYGAGKTFLLKLVEKLALEQNFAVSYIKFHSNYQVGGLKFFYRDLINGLKTKNEISFEQIINNWLDNLKKTSFEYDEDDIEFFNQKLHDELYNLEGCTLSFKSALERYNNFRNFMEYEEASTILSWLSGDNSFYDGNVDIDVFGFVKSLSSLLKYINYSGLVILVDDIENIMCFKRDKRNNFYEYIKILMDDLSLNCYKSTFIIFAGTPEWFEQPQKGIPSYETLEDMIKNVLYNDLENMRKPILNLKGFNMDNLNQIAGKLIIIHEKAYNWNASDKINPMIGDIVSIHLNDASLTGGKVTPRTFIRSFISVLDTVQQNQRFFNDPHEIIELFGKQVTCEGFGDEIDFDDIDEFDEDW